MTAAMLILLGLSCAVLKLKLGSYSVVVSSIEMGNSCLFQHKKKKN